MKIYEKSTKKIEESKIKQLFLFNKIKKREKQSTSTTKESLKAETPVNKKRKLARVVQDDADGYNSATKKLKSQLE